MSRQYNSSWDSQKLTINFNQKQWRQDFASFVKEQKFWDSARVTRARSINKSKIVSGIKSFEVYNRHGNSLKVTYQDDNKIIDTTDNDVVIKYFKERGI